MMKQKNILINCGVTPFNKTIPINIIDENTSASKYNLVDIVSQISGSYTLQSSLETEKTRIDMANLAIDNIKEFFDTNKCINRVN